MSRCVKNFAESNVRKKVHVKNFANNTKLLLHLSLIKNVGPASILKIINKLKNDFYLQDLYFCQVGDFVKKFGLSIRISKIIFDGLKDKKNLEEELSLIEKYKIELLSFLDEKYPESLKQIYHPPLIIYSKGASLQSSKKIAIVGSRKADNYGKKTIKNILPELIKNNYTIVSGGAVGIDSIAHEETIKLGGETIAIFGSGLMCPYPKSNKELFRKIVQNSGTLISSFPLKTPPSRGNFPARNRIISGLSDGCLVIQAARKSGALITTNFALDQGKQVFAVPGPIENEISQGCHKLIQQGAKLVTCANDIFEELGAQILKPERSITTERPITPAKQILKHESPILKHLSHPCSIDELSNKTKFSVEKLQAELFSLQLNGKVRQNFAGLWEKAL